MRPLNPLEACPCNSGALLKDCCTTAKGLVRTKPVKLSLRGTKTRYQHASCYLNYLRDCSPTISREHFISHGIMKELGENGVIRISGFHWQPEGERKRPISMSSLTGKVLCSRHNTMLSPLDSKALRFFKSFLIAGDEFQDPQLKLVERVWLFNGHDLERWMLKS